MNSLLKLSPFTLYLWVIFLLSIVTGLQIIALPWLALDYLGLSPWALGVVQSAVLAPSVLLLVVGGVSADRGVLRRQWLWLLLLYGAVHGVLLLLLGLQWLSLGALLVYGLMLGCIAAFMQPLKEYLTGLFAEEHLQSRLAKHSLFQSIGQGVGIALATPLYLWRVESLPLVQLGLVVLALGCFLGFMRRSGDLLSADNTRAEQQDKDDVGGKLSWSLLASGFHCCWQSVVLRSLIALVAVIGFFHIGVFIVALPLLAKEIYVGDVAFYSILQGLFLAGTIATTLVVVLRGPLDAPGRRVIFSVLYAGLILLGLSAGPTQYGLLLLVFLWGVVVGVSSNLGRAILQSQALAAYRGRAISIYQLALFGAAPLGAFFAGIATEYWGVLWVLKVSAMASFVAFFATFLTRSLWDLEAV